MVADLPDESRRCPVRLLRLGPCSLPVRQVRRGLPPRDALDASTAPSGSQHLDMASRALALWAGGQRDRVDERRVARVPAARADERVEGLRRSVRGRRQPLSVGWGGHVGPL